MTAHWFHPVEEASTVGVLLEHFEKHQGGRVRVTFSDGESYLCHFLSSYDSDNEYEIDEGIETQPDDFFAVALEIDQVYVAGSHGQFDRAFDVSYRDFPVQITDEKGVVIYSKAQ